MRAAIETIPATGQKAPPKSFDDVAMRLAFVTVDSMMDPSIIILGAWGTELRPWAEWGEANKRGVVRSSDEGFESRKIILMLGREVWSEGPPPPRAFCVFLTNSLVGGCHKGGSGGDKKSEEEKGTHLG